MRSAIIFMWKRSLKMSKKVFLKKTYADVVKGVAEWDFVHGESIIKPQLIGFHYKQIPASPIKASPKHSRHQTQSPKLVTKKPSKTPTKKIFHSSPIIVSSPDTPANLERNNPVRSSPRLSAKKETTKSLKSSPAYHKFGQELSSDEYSPCSPFSKIQKMTSSESDSPSLMPSLIRSRKRKSKTVTADPMPVVQSNSCFSPFVISDTSDEEISKSPVKKGKISLVKRKLFAPVNTISRSDTDQNLSDSIDESLTNDSETSQEFSECYDNDSLLPIYKALPSGIKTKDAVSLLLRKLKSNQLAKNVPTEINRNVSFVYSIKSIGHWKNALCDGMGRWNQNGKETIFVNLDDDTSDISIVKKKHLSDSSLKVIRRKYNNASYSQLHRVEIHLEDTHSGSVLDQLFVQYYFEGDEKTVIIAPHGNSKGTAKYQRTNETTKRRIKELCQTNSQPKDIFHSIIEEQGGLSEVKSGAHIARDRQQIHNFKREIQISNTSDPITECSDLAKIQEKKQDRFLRDVRSAPEFTMFMSTDRQLKDIEKFCTDEKCLSVLGVDTTFNIGTYYVTITTYRHLMLTNSFGVEPVMIGPILLHQRKSFELSSSMLQNCQNLKNLKVFGTDGDVNLGNAFQVCFEKSSHLLCDIHMVDNIERKLKSLNIRGKEAKQFLNDIFGSVNGNVRIKGLVDCMSDSEMDETMEYLSEKWISHGSGEEFLQYFIEHKLDLIKHCMSAEIRSKCGLGFPPKPYTQNGNECINSVMKTDIFADNKNKNKRLDPYDFVKIAEKTVKRQENEIKLSLIGRGEYKLKQAYQHLAIPEDAYWRKTPQQREAVFKRMQNEPLKAEETQQETEINTPNLMQSVANEIKNIGNDLVPNRTLTDIFNEADSLTKQNYIVTFPGTENKFLIANRDKPADPYTLTYAQSSSSISCEKKCSRWNGFKICEHSIALASYLGILKKYLEQFSKRHDKCNITNLANTNMPTFRGRKATTATQRRKGKASKTSTEILSYNVNANETTQENQKEQPFHLTFIAGLIKKSVMGVAMNFKEEPEFHHMISF